MNLRTGKRITRNKVTVLLIMPLIPGVDYPLLLLVPKAHCQMTPTWLIGNDVQGGGAFRLKSILTLPAGKRCYCYFQVHVHLPSNRCI